MYLKHRRGPYSTLLIKTEELLHSISLQSSDLLITDTQLSSKGILLSEETIWGALAKKALSWVGKNEDDIALLFKTTVKTLAKSIDDIVEVAS